MGLHAPFSCNWRACPAVIFVNFAGKRLRAYLCVPVVHILPSPAVADASERREKKYRNPSALSNQFSAVVGGQPTIRH